jgi:hypothetical protein
MESVGNFVGGLGTVQCPDLVGLTQHRGPFASVYVNTEAAAEDAPHRMEIRWKDLRRELEACGIDPATISAVGSSLADARFRGTAVGIVAAHGEVLAQDASSSPLRRELLRVGSIPSLGPILEWCQHRMTYATVACDHAGADIELVSASDERTTTTAGDTDRHDPELHKAHGGGWSHRRFEQRVENAWERNARQVLDLLDTLVRDADPKLVLYGGDPHACSLIAEHASATLRPRLHEVSLSRAADGSERHDAHAVGVAVATAVATDTARLLGQLRQNLTGSLGVEGTTGVLAALTAAQVDTLLVHCDADDDRVAYLSPDPLVVGLDEQEVASFGGETCAGRVADVAIWAAFLTGAKVRMAPGSPIDDGMAALLRFPL